MMSRCASAATRPIATNMIHCIGVGETQSVVTNTVETMQPTSPVW